MGSFTPLKIILGVFLLGNLIFFGYNAYTTYQRFQNEDLTRAGDGAVVIKRNQQRFKSDLKKITSQNIIKVESASEHFQETARRLGFDTVRDVYIPAKPNTIKKTNFIEESWKIEFRNKEKTFSLKQIANFGNAIEISAPGFQVKEIDMGKRISTWGKDEWNPSYITIRRLERKRTG
ncbi:MAG: hypothetical protein V3W41_16510 [Planctomycetota bacterium]